MLLVLTERELALLSTDLTAEQLLLVLTERELAAQQRWQNAYQKAAQQRCQNGQELTRSVVAEVLSSFASVVAVLDTEQSGVGKGGPSWSPVCGMLHVHRRTGVSR